MTDDIRYQPKCFFASREYSSSFWGRFIYLYQGKGSLRLTRHSLCLEDCPQGVEIPFKDIKSIGLSRFSTWSKPLGLSRLVVNYFHDDEPRTLHLVPFESIWDPTPKTSRLVSSWHETLGNVEELTNRVEPPQFDPSASESTTAGLYVIQAALLGVFLIFFLIWMSASFVVR